MEEEGVWQTPKRMRLVTQSRTVGQPTSVTPIENPFSPLAGCSDKNIVETDREKSQKAERPPSIFIKNVTNINALINTFNAEDINTCPPRLSPVAEDIPVCPPLPSLSKGSQMARPFEFNFIVAPR